MIQTRRLLFAIFLIAFSGGCWLAANAQQPTVTVRDGETVHDALKRDALTGKSTLEFKKETVESVVMVDGRLEIVKRSISYSSAIPALNCWPSPCDWSRRRVWKEIYGVKDRRQNHSHAS
ncbi:MAG: hypothetical protein JNK38_01160 [Acidobacteria bacterium]|nr:hypothetical protein [Acidobacteriota bacterium]